MLPEKQFKKIMSFHPCYSLPEMNKLRSQCSCYSDILNISIAHKDLLWLAVNLCPSPKQKQLFVVRLAVTVAPIHNKKHPNDSRVKDCIVVTRRYIKNDATSKELIKARNDAYAATYAADAATYAATYAAAYAADAAYAAGATYAATYATCAADAAATYVATYAADAAAYAADIIKKQRSLCGTILRNLDKKEGSKG